MPDRNKFTPPPVPPDFEDQAPLRETFLYHFSDEDAERFRHVGNFIFQAFMESAHTMLPKEFPQSDSWRELNAALQDLRYSQHRLALIAASLEHSSLELPDIQIALAAADFSGELGQLCDRIEEILR